MSKSGVLEIFEREYHVDHVISHLHSAQYPLFEFLKVWNFRGESRVINLSPAFNFTTYQQEVLGTASKMKITLSIKAFEWTSIICFTSNFTPCLYRHTLSEYPSVVPASHFKVLRLFL